MSFWKNVAFGPAGSSLYMEEKQKCGDEMGRKTERNAITKEDKRFFQQLFEEYKDFMYFIAGRYTADPVDCEDTVQEAVLRLMGNIPTLRSFCREKKAKYIMLTVKTAYLDCEKRKHRDRVVFLDDETLEAVQHMQAGCEPDGMRAEHETIEALKAQLPARDWMVLEGKYILGYSQEELAELMGVLPDSVRMILHRAREKARRILTEDKEGF